MKYLKYIQPRIQTIPINQELLFRASLQNHAEDGTGHTETGGTSEEGGDAHDRYSKYFSNPIWTQEEYDNLLKNSIWDEEE